MKNEVRSGHNIFEDGMARACSHDPGTTHCPGATH